MSADKRPGRAASPLTPRGDLRVLGRAADGLTGAQRVELGHLIVAGFPHAPARHGTALCEQWARRAWRTTPAIAHCVTESAGRVVAQLSIFRLTVPSGVMVFGLGDIVVDERYRGLGLARQLIGLAVEEAQRRGAKAICARTVKLATVFAHIGFRFDPWAAWFADEDGRAIPDLWAWRASAVRLHAARVHPSDF